MGGRKEGRQYWKEDRNASSIGSNTGSIESNTGRQSVLEERQPYWGAGSISGSTSSKFGRKAGIQKGIKFLEKDSNGRKTGWHVVLAGIKEDMKAGSINRKT